MSGKIRVLFGSTEMLGTGVNAQKDVLQSTIWMPLGDRQTLNNGTVGVFVKATILPNYMPIIR
jgi:hypothetical protein